MRLAIATCRELPEWEVDDVPLHAALTELGLPPDLVPWDDPAADWAGYDACLIRTTWDYATRREEFCAWADAVGRRTRLFNPPATVRWNTHKGYLRELAGEGIPIVPTVWLDAGSTPDLGRLVDELGAEKAILKPAVGATARELLPFTRASLAEAAAHAERLLVSEDLMLQPFLPTVLGRGELSVVFVDGEPAHAVRKTPAEGDYRVQDDFGGRDEPVACDGLAIDPIRTWLAARPELLYARADYLVDGEGALLLNELELVEPSLYFRHAPESARRLAAALAARLAAGEGGGAGRASAGNASSVH